MGITILQYLWVLSQYLRVLSRRIHPKTLASFAQNDSMGERVTKRKPNLAHSSRNKNSGPAHRRRRINTKSAYRTMSRIHHKYSKISLLSVLSLPPVTWTRFHEKFKQCLANFAIFGKLWHYISFWNFLNPNRLLASTSDFGAQNCLMSCFADWLFATAQIKFNSSFEKISNIFS